ncbi:hypothetical protein M011DRAFT_59312 [Sporormia fimetaria CBS 119925]|uniref:DC-UbP/UBTD2 N-terminal domain-containing protein n=1 Tax=Sporormia fimetaria CBS 119925 TaxID=1340428 RepID=A0A6A6VCG1_9PLEO|nr:hypothetical protein M011DRAFT_59312 [Sporormia fimetaria CBS 119925]
MGNCCSQRASSRSVAEADDTAPVARLTPNSDNVAAPSTASHSNRRPRSSDRFSQHQPRSNLPNLPLRPLPQGRRCDLPDPYTIPTSTAAQNPGGVRWTRAKLERERRDWWDTRDHGNRFIWEAYRRMIELLQKGEVQETQELLDATGCTCPSGKLWHSIFDETGVEYAIKEVRRNFDWVVFEPKGLVEDGVMDGVAEEEWNVHGKGKGRAVEGEGNRMQVRCRLSTTGKDVQVELRLGEPVGCLMERLADLTGVDKTRIKVSYLGRLYSSKDFLPTTGPQAFKDSNVLTILIMGES